ncbi:hypothetical protein ACRAWD_27460 [Caulobacter segnis]
MKVSKVDLHASRRCAQIADLEVGERGGVAMILDQDVPVGPFAKVRISLNLLWAHRRAETLELPREMNGLPTASQ